jgi:hypothetical protein
LSLLFFRGVPSHDPARVAGFVVSPLGNVPLALQSVRRTILRTESLGQLIFLRSAFHRFPVQ